MPAWALRRPAAAALFGYVCVSLVFAWPLPLHLADSLLGPPGGDTGVYAWNIWVFSHEILHNRQYPFLTSEILALSGRVPLALHNYTTFANLLAVPLLPWFGVVRTFNLLVIGAGVLSAWAMFLYARVRTGDAAAAWVGGLLFGFSPFMMARGSEHFSLTLAAPLPVFAWLLYRIWSRPTFGLACAAGGTVAWAFLCDTYYAVYCLLMAVFMAAYSAIAVERRPVLVHRIWWTSLVNLALLLVGGLIAGVVIRGGGRFELLGLRVSMTQLYTPVLAFTVLLLIRLALGLHRRLGWRFVPSWPRLRLTVAAGAACACVLAPVLYAAGSAFAQRNWISPRVWWRSSPPGVDLLAFLLPNPAHPWFGHLSTLFIASRPNGYHENVASLPWVAIATVLIAVWATRFRPPPAWVIFTAVWACLALGPFVRVAGVMTHVPTPWTLLRYAPVIGAARMPTRLTVLVTLGLAMLLAMALAHMRARSRRPALLTGGVAALLLFELFPAPRAIFPAAVPAVYFEVARDPRPVRVLTLPFGLKDGLSTRGSFSSATQFYQTVHGKRLVGGYLSRLPGGSIERYRSNVVLRVLMRLSEGRALDPGDLERAGALAPSVVSTLELGYVVIDTAGAAPALAAFAKQAFELTPMMSADGFELYRTRLAPPLDIASAGQPTLK